MSHDVNKLELDYGRSLEKYQSNDDSMIEFFGHYLERHNITFMPKSSKILDIGCATGNLLITLRHLGYENVQGVEIDEKQFNTCRRRGLNVSHSLAVDFLQEKQTSFDIVFLLDVLEHMPKAEQLNTLRLIWQAMSSSGVLMLSVPNALSPLSHYFEHNDWTHYCSFAPSSIGFLLENSGFTHFQLRPSHQEPYELRIKKQPWVDLLEMEFNIKKPIMTPSIVAVCFKNVKQYEEYLRKAPDLMKFDRPKKFTLNSLKKLIARFKTPDD